MYFTRLQILAFCLVGATTAEKVVDQAADDHVEPELQNLKFEFNSPEDGYVIKGGSGSPDIKVKQLRFVDNKRPELKSNTKYLGFVRYFENRDFGTVYLTEEANVINNNCDKVRNTRHAGAFKYFFQQCPNDSQDKLIVSGICYSTTPSNDGAWDFRSGTFNTLTFSNQRNSYLNADYYNDDNGREAHSDEKQILKYCMKEWLVKSYNPCHTGNARWALLAQYGTDEIPPIQYSSMSCSGSTVFYRLYQACVIAIMLGLAVSF